VDSDGRGRVKRAGRRGGDIHSEGEIEKRREKGEENRKRNE
jgi:hypothetical protein